MSPRRRQRTCRPDRTPRSHVVFGIAAILVASLATAGGQALPRLAASPASLPLIGVEYAFSGEATALARTGASAVKYFPDDYAWAKMQAGPDAAIDFSVTDRFVREYEDAGFTDLVLTLKSLSSWASREGRADPTPRPEFSDLYEHWVGAIVERYDGDGVDDMPGLRWPVRIYEIGAEFSSYEPEPVDEYLDMLSHAYAAAHAAFPDVRVAHAAFLTTTAFASDPDPSHYEQAFAAVSPRIMVHPLADIRAVLDRSDIFDLVDFHALGDPDEIVPTVAWLRWEMSQRGIERPIVISDTATTPFIAWGPATTCTAPPSAMGLVIPPAREADRCRLAAYFTSLVAGDPATVEWTHAFAGSDLVEKVVVAAEQGVSLVDAWSTEDVPLFQIPLLQAGAGTAAWAGMLDVSFEALTQERVVIGLRPGHADLVELVRHLRDATGVRRIANADPRVRWFAIEPDSLGRWVGWLAPDDVVLPGDPAPTASVTVATGPGPVVMETAPSQSGSSAPDCTALVPTGGSVTVELSPTPIYLLAGPGSRCTGRSRPVVHTRSPNAAPQRLAPAASHGPTTGPAGVRTRADRRERRRRSPARRSS
jgi:hypothetical protein